MNIRRAVVSGRFYPDSVQKLDDMMDDFSEAAVKKGIDYSVAKQDIFGFICPHAGYIYSGSHAVYAYEMLKKYEENIETYIIITPNHTGYGERISVSNHDMWETPYGKALVDKELAEALASHDGIEISNIAHEYEHSGEVMIPFLQRYAGNSFKIVVITLLDQSVRSAEILSEAIIKASERLNRKILIIASSDFTHYMSPETAKKLDTIGLKKILENDVNGFHNEVLKNNLSICGTGPIMTLMLYSKKMAGDETKIKLLSYGNSGEVYPADEVVGYASLVFYRERGV